MENKETESNTPKWEAAKLDDRRVRVFFEEGRSGWLDIIGKDSEETAKIVVLAPEMLEALKHCYKVFLSMSERGAYPAELLPDEFREDNDKLFLGKQGFHFVSELLMRATGASSFNEMQSILSEEK